MANNVEAAVAGIQAATSKAQIGAEIVTQTLDTFNSKTYAGKNDQSETYEFSKKVLSAVYAGKGTIADSEG